jgi:hypothetical protein
VPRCYSLFSSSASDPKTTLVRRGQRTDRSPDQYADEVCARHCRKAVIAQLSRQSGDLTCRCQLHVASALQSVHPRVRPQQFELRRGVIARRKLELDRVLLRLAGHARSDGLCDGTGPVTAAKQYDLFAPMQ